MGIIVRKAPPPPKKLISFAIPSNRDMNEKSKVVDNIFKRASDPSRIEIVFRVDTIGEILAYKTTENYINTIKDTAGEWKENVKVIVGDPLYGYCSIGDFHNDIIKEYTGEFLILYNDDCEEITQGYDEKIEPYTGKVVILNVNNQRNNFDFFVISRKFIELNNGVIQTSPFVNYDLGAWAEYFPEICHRLDIEVGHHPKAQFGRGVSQGHACLDLADEGYIWSCVHLGKDGKIKKLRSDENGLNKWVKLVCIDIRNMKNILVKNPKKLIYKPKEFGPDKWTHKKVEIGIKGQCKCCPFDGEEVATMIEESGLLI